MTDERRELREVQRSPETTIRERPIAESPGARPDDPLRRSRALELSSPLDVDAPGNRGSF